MRNNKYIQISDNNESPNIAYIKASQITKLVVYKDKEKSKWCLCIGLTDNEGYYLYFATKEEAVNKQREIIDEDNKLSSGYQAVSVFI